MSKRVNVMIEDDAYAMLDQLADSPNKRGKLLSELVRKYYSSRDLTKQIEQMDTEPLRTLILGALVRIRELECQVDGLKEKG